MRTGADQSFCLRTAWYSRARILAGLKTEVGARVRAERAEQRRIEASIMAAKRANRAAVGATAKL